MNDNTVHYLPEGTELAEGKYIIEDYIGAGGFGVTYLAWNTVLESRVAIKEYMPGEFSTRMPGATKVTIYGGEKHEQFESGLEKFFEESQRLAQFTDIPGIVQIFDCFKENNTAYIVMEYLQGETLEERIKREGKLDFQEAMTVIIPVLNAIAAVHRKGLVHRDIAPNNIVITDEGKIKVIDFGAARGATGTHSKSLTVMFKTGYTAEEQYRSNGVQGSWTDVYSAAATMYKMLTGITPEGAMERRVKDELQSPRKLGVKIPSYVDCAIMNAMNVTADNRTKTAEQFISELAGGTSVKKHYKSIAERKTGAIPLRVWMLGGAGIVFAITLIVLLNIGFFDQIISDIGTATTGKMLIPNVEGVEADNARDILIKRGIKEDHIECRELDYVLDVPDGWVESQSIEGGTWINGDETIVLSVSGKAQKNPIPELKDLSYEEARKTLEDSQYRVKEVYEAGYVQKDRVIRSYPTAGSLCMQGNEVQLIVSSGFDHGGEGSYTVEDLSGQSYEEVQKEIGDRYAIYVVEKEERYDDEIPKGMIIEQTPKEGTLNGEDSIEVVVSLGIEQIEVPELVSMKQAEAEALLDGMNLGYTVRKTVDRNAEEGTVLSQSIVSGQEVDKYTKITLEVSTQGYEVPSLMGLTKDAAELICAQNGFALNVTEVRGGTGSITKQTPAAGDFVDNKGTINVDLAIPDSDYNRKIEDTIIAQINQDLASSGMGGVSRTSTAMAAAQSYASTLQATGTAPGRDFLNNIPYSGYTSTYRGSGSFTSAYQIHKYVAGSEIGFGYVGNDIRVVIFCY